MLLRIALAIVLCVSFFAAVPDAAAQSASSGKRDISVKRSSRQAPGTDLEAYNREKEYRERREAEEEERADRRRRWDREEEEEEAPRGPSTGPSCMYAADGTLVFAPRGRRCAGAEKAPKATPRPRSTKTATSARKATGSCMRGADGKVIYAPPGVDCGD